MGTLLPSMVVSIISVGTLESVLVLGMARASPLCNGGLLTRSATYPIAWVSILRYVPFDALLVFRWFR